MLVKCLICKGKKPLFKKTGLCKKCIVEVLAKDSDSDSVDSDKSEEESEDELELERSSSSSDSESSSEESPVKITRSRK